MQNKKLPVGIDDFEKLIREDFYYVDKTLMIRDLLSSWSEVNLFTRPRRFGKSLILSMLYQFFDTDTDKSVFEGLNIVKCKEICTQYMGKFPVIYISLKSIEGLSFDSAFSMLKILFRDEVRRIRSRIGDENLSEEEKLYLASFSDLSAPPEEYRNILKGLTEILATHYNSKVIILIDEYDVPLDKAYISGYYDDMISFIRGLFGNALKTSRNLFFSVLTGCMRVSKESIFTGINNLDANTIIDERHDEYFGFTEEEVRNMLVFYGLEGRNDDMKNWYDGYRFGSSEIYCPWDVICAVKKLTVNPHDELQPFWINTSGNDIVRRFIDKADRKTRDEIESLMAGESVEKRICMELTYRDMESSIDNLWSIMFVTGYLTIDGKPENGRFRLRIPNREIREVFASQISTWFSESLIDEDNLASDIAAALKDGNAEQVETLLNSLLSRTISILDTNAPHGRKESFYHGMLLGLFAGRSTWLCRSNTESGDGFADLMIYTDDPDQGIVIEVKYSDSLKDMERYAERAINQAEERNYPERFRQEGISDILVYGIAFFRKRCRVAVKKAI